MRLIVGDCVESMRSLDEGSVDAVVTDPPYGLRFMGKDWDDAGDGAAQQEWHRRWAVEAFRVLKPGGHLLAFGGSRTYHRLASAVEEAGFEVRDQMMWLYGSGFPKSHNLDGEWQGWGTALKPAHEPIVVARKPLVGTVAANVLAFGTGALNVDGCRIAGAAGDGNWAGATAARGYEGGWDSEAKPNVEQHDAGRWPANVVLDPVAAAMLDEQSGDLTSGANPTRRGSDKFRFAYGDFVGQAECVAHRGTDSGGASRFFYCAKASSRERNAGLDGFSAERVRQSGHADKRVWDIPGSHAKRRANYHPTVKPVDLMRYLVRLVTPPGGTVLDPFTGSGTTGIAAALEGMDFIGCEREQEYADIARARIEWWERHAGDGDTDEILAAAERREQTAQAGQLELGEAA